MHSAASAGGTSWTSRGAWKSHVAVFLGASNLDVLSKTSKDLPNSGIVGKGRILVIFFWFLDTT